MHILPNLNLFVFVNFYVVYRINFPTNFMTLLMQIVFAVLWYAAKMVKKSLI